MWDNIISIKVKHMDVGARECRRIGGNVWQTSSFSMVSPALVDFSRVCRVMIKLHRFLLNTSVKHIACGPIWSGSACVRTHRICIWIRNACSTLYWQALHTVLDSDMIDKDVHEGSNSVMSKQFHIQVLLNSNLEFVFLLCRLSWGGHF